MTKTKDKPVPSIDFQVSAKDNEELLGVLQTFYNGTSKLNEQIEDLKKSLTMQPSPEDFKKCNKIEQMDFLLKKQAILNESITEIAYGLAVTSSYLGEFAIKTAYANHTLRKKVVQLERTNNTSKKEAAEKIGNIDSRLGKFMDDPTVKLMGEVLEKYKEASIRNVEKRNERLRDGVV